MNFEATPLSGSFLISVKPFEDSRGAFFRFFCRKEFAEMGLEPEWVQLNHSITRNRGALRGMHYQRPPYSEIKMVKCIAGAVFDVIVDLRRGSPSFLQWFGTELSAENRKMLYIPEGFAHGFQCLTDDCQLIYHHSQYYTPEAEAGLRFDDPALNIRWPLVAGNLSARDAGHPFIDQHFIGI